MILKTTSGSSRWQGPYLLCMGTARGHRKNVVRVIEAYDKLRRTCYLPHKLIVVGPRGVMAKEIFGTVVQLGLQNEVIFAGYVADEDMPRLYALADALIFPSLFEGFGLPVVEAMACGCPIAASNATAIPKCANGAALLFDPFEPTAIAEGIHRLLIDRVLCEQLAETGYQQLHRFSWQTIVPQLLAIYRQVAANPAVHRHAECTTKDRPLTVVYRPSSVGRTIHVRRNPEQQAE